MADRLIERKQGLLAQDGPESLRAKFNDKIYEIDPDTPLGYRIKRPVSKDLHHLSDLLKDNSNFIAICGTTGTGKSTALLTLLPLFSQSTKYLILASAKNTDPVHEACESFCEDRKIIFAYVHDPDQFSETITKILDGKSADDHVIVIFDDFNINYSSSSAEEYNKIMIKVFALLRSANCSGIVITQTYNNLPTKVRENLNMRIVFALGNVYSVRSLLSDISGMFFDGSNEKILKNQLANIYRDVYTQPHKFIIVSSQPQPQIRNGWKEIIFPHRVDEVQVQGESLGKSKRSIGSGIIHRNELYKTAVGLGFPKYMFKTATPSQLESYIKVKSSQDQIDPSVIDKILEYEESPSKLRRQLLYNIKAYKRSQNPINLEKVSTIAGRLVSSGEMPEIEAKYILKTMGMGDYIDLGGSEGKDNHDA